MPTLLTALRAGGFLFMVAVFGYGVVFYPDAPLRPCGPNFCGKTNQLHTLAQYQGFRMWELILILTWVVGIPALVVLRAIEKDGGQ